MIEVNIKFDCILKIRASLVEQTRSVIEEMTARKYFNSTLYNQNDVAKILKEGQPLISRLKSETNTTTNSLSIDKNIKVLRLLGYEVIINTWDKDNIVKIWRSSSPLGVVNVKHSLMEQVKIALQEFKGRQTFVAKLLNENQSFVSLASNAKKSMTISKSVSILKLLAYEVIIDTSDKDNTVKIWKIL